jgi:hypothetical protein
MRKKADGASSPEIGFIGATAARFDFALYGPSLSRSG